MALRFCIPLLAVLSIAAVGKAPPSSGQTQTKYKYEARQIDGWTVHVRTELLQEGRKDTEHALVLLKGMLDQIVKTVPKQGVAELKKVQLWFSPEYPNTPPRAEYHPGAQWLKEHGRNPDMAKGVEFTNVRIFEAELRRMPNFALHELAHSYHDRVLKDGFDNAEIKAGYERVKASGKYDQVERQDAEGRKSMSKHYALTNPQEYFAESTESFFASNDFYPYNSKQLKEFDPETYDLVAKMWGIEKKQ